MVHPTSAILRSLFSRLPALPAPGLPQSLRSQFMLGITALSLLIVAIGMAGVYTLRNGSTAAQRLAEQQREQAEQSQRTALHLRAAERELERLLSAATAAQAERSHAALIDQIRGLEQLLGAGPPAAGEAPHAGVRADARQLRASVEHLRALQRAAGDGNDTLPAPAEARRIAAQHAEVLLRSEALVAGVLQHEVGREQAYREALGSLVDHSVGNQRGIVLLLVIALLFTWMVASLFLGRHLLSRLQQVSRHLRGDDGPRIPLSELADGADEIADMARAVRQLLADREALQARTAELSETKETLVEHGRILEMVAERQPLAAVLERLVAMTQARRPGLHAAILPPGDAGAVPPGLHLLGAEAIRSHDDVLLGWFVTCADAPREADVHDRQAIHAAARLAGIAIERQRAEQRIRHMAHHDELTGLPNRALLNDRLAQALVQARRGSRPLGLLFLDLDGFKDVNDSLGHGTGDRLLKSVADRLGSLVRAGDTVARLGGDEFVVMLESLARADDAVNVGRVIAQALARPHLVDGHALHVTASIGIATFPDDGDDADTLLSHADAAMYRAKAAAARRRGRTTAAGLQPAT